MNNLADKYICSHCETVYGAADLEFTVKHSALGKYTVSPDVYDADCPFCGAKESVSEVPTREVAITDEKVPAPKPTMTQSCISHGCTIKPQINWTAFDKEYGHLVKRY